MEKTRLLLVDDHALSRESLGRILAAEPDFDVTGQCGTTAEALDLLNRTPSPDVVLLDLDSEYGNRFISVARQAGFRGTVLIVTASIHAAELMSAMQSGAAGVFLKDNSPETLARAIRLVARGEVWMDRKLIELMADHVQRPGVRQSRNSLTERERQVLQGVFEGLTNRKIATHIGVSEGTVKATLQQLFHKTHVRTRSQLVRAAIEQSLLVAETQTSQVH